MKTKNLRKAIALGISSMVMTGLLTSTVAFAAPVAGQQYTTFTSTGSTAEGIKAGDATITINDNGYNSHAKYTAYKVLDAEVSGTVYKYTAMSDFASLFATSGDYTLTEGGSIKKGTEAITSNSDLAKEFAQAVEAKAKSGTEFEVGKSVTLEPGYYVIVQTGSSTEDAWVPSLPILVDLPQKSGDNYVYNTTVEPKGGYPSITKKIVEKNTKYDKNDVSINEDVNYEITSDVTKYSTNAKNITYQIVDTLSKGLDYNNNAEIKAGTKTLNKDTDYTVTTSKTASGETRITFNFKYDSIKDADKVVLTYSAKLNKDAVIGEGPLYDETRRAIAEIKVGRNFDDAWMAMAQRLKSKELERIFTIILGSRKSGSSIANVIFDVSNNLRDMLALKRERKSSVMMAVMFLIISAVIASPFALGMVSVYSQFMQSFGKQTQLILAAPFAGQIYLVIHSVLVGLIVSIIMYGNVKKGIKFSVPLALVSYGIFYLISNFAGAMFLS